MIHWLWDASVFGDIALRCVMSREIPAIAKALSDPNNYNKNKEREISG